MSYLIPICLCTKQDSIFFKNVFHLFMFDCLKDTPDMLFFQQALQANTLIDV